MDPRMILITAPELEETVILRKEGKKIKELAERARKPYRFRMGNSPGGDIRWDKSDYDSLINKFSSMYDLGVRQFRHIFDDIKVKVPTLINKQHYSTTQPTIL